MLRRSPLLSRYFLATPPDLQRVNRRRQQLEQRRQRESGWYLPPVEPTAAQATALYRAMLKEGYATLRFTDKETYRRKLRFEFEEIARQTSGRVRGIMFEKGKWMLKNNLGGLM